MDSIPDTRVRCARHLPVRTYSHCHSSRTARISTTRARIGARDFTNQENPLMIRLLPLSILISALAGIASAAAPSDNNLGVVHMQPNTKPTVIAVCPFNVTGSGVEVETVPRIIRNDLELSGWFKSPPDQGAVNRLNLYDNRSGQIHFDEWTQMGVENYLMGKMTEDATSYHIQILLYDIKSQRTVITREFVDRKERLRDLSHQVSDAVIKFLKGVDGATRTKLLYVTERVPGTKEIGIMDADGFNAKPVTNLGKLATSPSWGANGTEAYFTSYHGNRANIYGMQLRPDASLDFIPGSMWTIAAYGGTNHSATWSQAAGEIAMVLSKDGNSEIYESKRDGSSLKRLTQSKFTEGSPAWSPDGRRVAFATNEAGGVQLFTMNADGSGKRQLTTRGSWNDAPSWSPAGDKIAFVSRIGGANEIFLISANGGEYHRLTEGQRNNESPVWAPDNSHIAFSSNRSGTWQIYMMLDDGSSQKQLTSTGRSTLPDWGPNPGKAK
ncbi:Tol-Pal system beta propeller repeat protein TolB [soil metagenome]